MSLQSILKAKRAGMVFQPAYLSNWQRENFLHVMGQARKGELREVGYTYNPEAPYFQRVPGVHGAPIPDDILFKCVIHIAQHELRTSASAYPSFRRGN